MAKVRHDHQLVPVRVEAVHAREVLVHVVEERDGALEPAVALEVGAARRVEPRVARVVGRAAERRVDVVVEVVVLADAVPGAMVRPIQTKTMARVRLWVTNPRS